MQLRKSESIGYDKPNIGQSFDGIHVHFKHRIRIDILKKYDIRCEVKNLELCDGYVHYF